VKGIHSSRHAPNVVTSHGTRSVPATMGILWCFVFTSATFGAAPPITAAAFSPDGRSVVIGSQQGLAVHSWPDLRPQKTITTGRMHIHGLTFSPDGKTLAAVGGAPGENGVAELLSWPEGRLLSRVEPHSDLVYDFAWRQDGSWASASIDGLVQVFDGQGQLLHKLSGHSRGVLAVVVLQDGKTLCTASIDHSIRVWDLETGRPLRNMNQHTGPVVGLAVRPGTTETAQMPMMASIAEDRTARIWQPTIGRLVRFARLTSPPLTVAWTPDGQRLVVACRDGHVRTLDPDSAEVVSDQKAIDGWAYTLAISPASDACIVGGAGGQLRRVELASLSAPNK